MNKFIKQLSLAIVLVVLLSGCLFVSENLEIKNLPIYGGENGFKWGIGFEPYPNAIHSQENFDQVLKDTKKLGVKWLKIMVPDWDDDSLSFTTSTVAKCQKEGYQVVLGFQPKQSYETFPDAYQAGYDQAHKVVSKFPNISYFQLSNEPATGAIKQYWPGVSEESFDQDKYQKVLSWLRGASEATRKANPKAKRIITGHFLHFGFLEMLKRDNLDYEIIGWDWHSENFDLSKVENNGNTYNLLEILPKFNKDLWITEAGLFGGSQKGEDIQADYIKNLAEQVYNSKKFKGFFVFALYDGLPRPEANENNLGIIELTKTTDGQWKLGAPKQSYKVYQEIINKY